MGNSIMGEIGLIGGKNDTAYQKNMFLSSNL